jgi:DNA replication and repair protein RecF
MISPSPDWSLTSGGERATTVNGVDKRIGDAVGVLSAVAFLPEDIGMVSGSPGPRRRYLDETISQVDPRYRRELQQFKRVLSQRNHLLKSLRERNSNSDELAFWNQRLVKHGAYLLTSRFSTIRQWNALVQRIQLRLTSDSEWLQLQYRCAVDLQAPDAGQMVLQTGAQTTDQSELPLNEVRDRYAAHLETQKHEEMKRGMSLIGPHRDDIAFIVNGKDMTVYGSRGQQRTSALALKLTEVEWIAQSTGDPPVLLLDDVISELDATHRSCLEQVICEAPQALVTTTDTAQYSRTFLEQTTQWQVVEGRIQRLTPR